MKYDFLCVFQENIVTTITSRNSYYLCKLIIETFSNCPATHENKNLLEFEQKKFHIFMSCRTIGERLIYLACVFGPIPFPAPIFQLIPLVNLIPLYTSVSSRALWSNSDELQDWFGCDFRSQNVSFDKKKKHALWMMTVVVLEIQVSL